MWTKEQFEAWRSRPETKKFLAFLREVREDLKERWADGEHMDADKHAIAMVYGDIIGLDWDRDVASFYKIEVDENGEQVRLEAD